MLREREQIRGRLCQVCGKFFVPRHYQLRVGQGRFCSRPCGITYSLAILHSPAVRKKAHEGWLKSDYAKSLSSIRGPAHHSWKGGSISSGYRRIRVNNKADGEHRLVMQAHLGRKLGSDEVVHHINHDRLDNRLENLQVMTRTEHFNEHKKEVQAARRMTPLRIGQKITLEIAKTIKRASAQGYSRKTIAEAYGLTPTMIGYILNGKSWKHA